MSKLWKLLLSTVGLLLLLLLGWQMINDRSSAEPLTDNDVRTKVEDQYSGEVSRIIAEDDHYTATVQTDAGTYEVTVLKVDGSIANVQRVAGSDTTDQQQKEESSDPPEENSPSSETKTISEQEAERLALAEVDGEVDDVDLEENDGTIYYLVEIEQKDEREATVQVHAVTGEVMSVSWDD
ncbi:hypothetical protein M662_14890 [Bacillus sp. SB49]|uniref:PepSY domain-containing protein n=1 Tax=Bacillus sp. SB49 TaxID=1071080 RepID=UPI00041D6B6D|nr:PepSY domain-containing protein [Bacillus sp. SB49]QHT47713.1 hypothetical protein M662_14890 [Bacillus sp. SB49]